MEREKVFFATPMKPLPYLDSTSFPDILPCNLADTTPLQCLNITPINLERSNMNRTVTLHDSGTVSIRSDQRSDRMFDQFIDELTLASPRDTVTTANAAMTMNSEIDHLANRVQNLLRKSAKYQSYSRTSSDKQNRQASSVGDSSDTLCELDDNKQTDSTDIRPASPKVIVERKQVNEQEEIDTNDDYSAELISFSATTLLPSTEPNAFLEEKENLRNDVHSSPPLSAHNELFIASMNEAKNSSNESGSQLSRRTKPTANANTIMSEADKILERIHALMVKAKPNYSGNLDVAQSTNRSDRSISPASHTTVQTPEELLPEAPDQAEIELEQIPEQKPSGGDVEEESDSHTEYYEPLPVEKSIIMSRLLNQTFNSHIFTQKELQSKRVDTEMLPPIISGSSTDASPTTSSESSLCDLMPNRTISDEEQNCLSQMRRDTSDLRRLRQNLLQFERNYKLQQERRRARLRTTDNLDKAKSSKAANGATALRGSTKTTSTEPATTSANSRPKTRASQIDNRVSECNANHDYDDCHPKMQRHVKHIAVVEGARQHNRQMSSKPSFHNNEKENEEATEEEEEEAHERLKQKQAQARTNNNYYGDVVSRRVRFEHHKHIAEKIDQIHIDEAHLRGGRVCGGDRARRSSCEAIAVQASANNQEEEKEKSERGNQLCACCRRHMKMNRGETLRKHFDCLQIHKFHLVDDDDDDDYDDFYYPPPPARRPQTARVATRSSCEELATIRERRQPQNSSKSVQTSIMLDDDERRKTKMYQWKTRAKSVEDSIDYAFTNRRYRTMRRTPSPSPSSRSERQVVERIRKPVAYFVAFTESSKTVVDDDDDQNEDPVGRRRGKTKYNDDINANNRPTICKKLSGANLDDVQNANAIIQPVPAYTLQDAFARNCNSFRLRSSMRVRKIKDNEQLRVRTVEQRCEEIAQTYLMQKQIDHERLKMAVATQKSTKTSAVTKQNKNNQNNNQNNNNNNNNGNRNRSTNKNQQLQQQGKDRLFSQPLKLIGSRRVFTHREMRAQTEKVYRKLPEVQAQTVHVKREDEARRCRMMAEIFKQRLKENAIRGKLNWPITGQAITA